MGRAARTSSFDKPRRAQRARIALRCHPDTPSAAVQTIEVEIARMASGRVELLYRLEGDDSKIVWPAAGEPGRVDRLWETTCFEMFVKAADRSQYHEFNFSPSRTWAAYRFSDVREGMQVARTSPNAILVTPNTVSISLDLRAAPGLPIADDWPVALSAVIEEKGGVRSFWALKHPPGKPDFHHPDCFALILAPPGRA